MEDVSEIVEVFRRDLTDYLASNNYREAKFCRDNKLNRALFSRLRAGYFPTIHTIEKCYRVMDEAGFVSERRKRDLLIQEAKDGNLTEVIELATKMAAECTEI